LIDLINNVVPQYTAHWEALGVILGLKDHEIAIISYDNARQPSDGCRQMLMKWLQNDKLPTWGKLDDAIKLLKTGSLSDDLSSVKGGIH